MLASTKSNPLTTFITRSDTSLLSMQDYDKPKESHITLMFVTLRAKRALLKGKATRVTRADMNFDLVSFPKMERGVSVP